MDSNDIQLSEEHNHSIVSLINKIVAKSPHLSQLKAESVLFLRLVSVISLIETTLCSKFQLNLKRNSNHNQSVHVIKSWLNQYYNHEFIASLCRPPDHQLSHGLDSGVSTGHTNGNTSDDTVDDYSVEDVDRDIGVMALLVLFIAHKLRQSLPRIKAYFSPEWQTLSAFDGTLNEVINFDKLLDLIQNELCLKRKQLEVTKSKVLSLQSIINSRHVDTNKPKKTELDYRSNLFSEYEDNDFDDQRADAEDNGDGVSVHSEGSPIYVDHSSDDDYEPKNKSQKMSVKSVTKKPMKRGSIGRKSSRGRGRPSKQLSVTPIQVTPQPTSSRRSRGRPPKPKMTDDFIYEDIKEIPVEGTDGPDGVFVCETCGKEFAKEYRLVRHKFTHLGHKQFVCEYPECGASFDLKWKLAEHRVEHNGEAADEGEGSSLATDGQSLMCEWADCVMTFGSKRELTQHEHEMHANRSQSKYSCDWPQCREIFENKIDWRKHVRTHGKITPTECGYPGCPLSFYKLDSLETHRKIHETFTLDELT